SDVEPTSQVCQTLQSELRQLEKAIWNSAVQVVVRFVPPALKSLQPGRAGRNPPEVELRHGWAKSCPAVSAERCGHPLLLARGVTIELNRLPRRAPGAPSNQAIRRYGRHLVSRLPKVFPLEHRDLGEALTGALLPMDECILG